MWVLAVVPALTLGLESDKQRFGVVAVAVETDRGALDVVDVVLPIVRVALERNSRVYPRSGAGAGCGAGSDAPSRERQSTVIGRRQRPFRFYVFVRRFDSRLSSPR